MHIQIDIEALFILWKLINAGFDAYIVGGAVRDMLRSKATAATPISDYDFTTNATPEEILALFPESFYENSFGTVSITKTHLHALITLPVESREAQKSSSSQLRIIDVTSASKLHPSLEHAKTTFNEQNATEKTMEPVYEITTYRSDGAYENHRHPTSVSWGTTLQEDLERRDFTSNALALEVSHEILQSFFENQKTGVFPSQITLFAPDYHIIDYHGGQDDLRNHLIKTVGDPEKRFREDALRMLRALRFSVQLNMQIESETFAAIIANKELIKHVSWERSADEFLKMLASPFPREAIELLDETGLLEFILPELLEGKNVQQGGHHTTDVWEHSLSALAHCPATDPIVRLATLLHDIGKPATYRVLDGKPTFYNHEIVGARIAKQIAYRLKLSRSQTERLFILVRYHMFHYQPENTDASIRRFMRKVGLANIDDILDLREADRLGSGARKTSWRLEEMKQRMIEQLHQPLDVKDLAINGHELMAALQLKPGPLVGTLLNDLFEQVLENPKLNTTEQLLGLASKRYKELQ